MAYIGVSPSNGVRQKHTYTATASQTSFSGAGAEGISLSYKDSNYVDVYQNGVKLSEADYTATSGTAIVLAQGASVSDIVEVVVYDVFSVADTVSKADGGTFDNNINITGNLHITGTDTSDQIIIENTDAGTGTAPDVVLFRNSASPADNDAVGRIDFRGQDDGSNSKDYATIFSNITDATAATAAGSLSFQTRNGSNQAVRLFIGGDGSVSTPTLGTSNLALGVNAGNSIASGGNYNTVIGDEAGTALTTGDNNVAIGFEALNTEDAHGFNTAIGYQTLKTLNAGAEAYETAVGYKSGTALTTGVYNTLIGAQAGMALTEGRENIAVGLNALGQDTLGRKSVVVGYQALYTQNFTSATDSNNTVVGYKAAEAVTTGDKNTLMGSEAGDALTTGNQNVAVGYQALSGGTTYDGNTALGHQALLVANNTDGPDGNNVAIGASAGSAVTSGVRNVLIGVSTGASLRTGNDNIMIGKGSDVSANAAANQITIGNDINAGGNNNFAFGKASNVVTNDFDSDANWSRSSDRRKKREIYDQELGLDFVNDLRTVNFQWKPSNEFPKEWNDYSEENNMDTDVVMHGFIAQEVKEALDKHSSERDSKFSGWKEGEDGMQHTSREMFVIPLIKAVQELSAQVDTLKEEIKELKNG